MRSTPPFLVLLLGSLAFAGCLGGEDAPVASEEETLAEEAVATEKTGSVTGQVVASDLEVLEGVDVALSQAGTTAMQTKTDKQGKFTFNGVAPGTFRVQASTICCKPGLKEITVVAGEVTEVNFQLPRLTADDLQTPFVSEGDWSGFISCSVGIGTAVTGGVSLAACSLTADTAIEDTNEDFRHLFNWTKGVQDAVFALDWAAVGGISGTEFWFLVENSDCGFDTCSYTYVEEMSSETIVARVHDDDIEPAEWKWSAIEDGREMAFRIFASPNSPNLMYQQPFTVYYTAFHYQDAPEDYNPVPDQ